MGDRAKNYKVDAIEIHNGGSLPSANKAAEDLSKLMSLPGVAGSDAHQPSELCTVYTQVQSSMKVDEILSAIKKGFVKVPSFKKSIRF
jgi:hypothetical protein